MHLSLDQAQTIVAAAREDNSSNLRPQIATAKASCALAGIAAAGLSA